MGPRTKAASADGADKIPERLRFLCLHGYRQNADSFRAKIGSFRKVVQRYADFVFISAPHIAPPMIAGDSVNEEQRSWWFNKDDGSFKGTNRSGPAVGFGESVALVEKVWHEQGPFHGLLGFSQGACFVGLLCSMAQRDMIKIRPKYAIMAAGFQSSSLVHLNYYENYCSTPSLHIMGTTDEIIPPQMSRALAEYFEIAQPVVHAGGHYFPASGEQKPIYVETFHDWLRTHLEEKELAGVNAVTVDAEEDDSEGNGQAE